jgi:sugar/nucleoside kinase (ribokinase family)
MSIVAVGSVALDSVETPYAKKDDLVGGSATYFSLAASYFTKVHLVAVVGTDFPAEGRNKLAEHGIDLEGLEVVDGNTFSWKGRYGRNPNHRRTLETQLNVFERFKPQLPDRYKKCSVVFLGNIDPALQLEVLSQVESPEMVFCDTMNLWIETKRPELDEVLQKTTVLLINDDEARQLTGSLNIWRAAREILKAGPKYVIIKKGQHGAIMVSNEACFVACVFPMEEVLDPTGAGDAFAGGVAGYIDRLGRLDHRTLRAAIVRGTALASFAIEEFGIGGICGLSDEELDRRVEAVLEVARI